MYIYPSQARDLHYYSDIFKVPIALLLASNINNSGFFYNRPAIKIPGYVAYSYQVQPYESIQSIANKFAINSETICLVNGLTRETYLINGQLLLIPIKINKPIVNPYEPFTYEKLVRELTFLQDIYPFLYINTIGQSVLGKPVQEVSAGLGEKRVHINSSFHANEWITTNVLMKFLNDYALALVHNKSIKGYNAITLFNQTQLSLVPMVNPDGVNLVLLGAFAAGPLMPLVTQINRGKTSFKDWKANIRGVDLNNQYPADWHIEVPRKPLYPSPRDFPGYYPLSEPEAQTMANLTSYRNFHRVVALHTQGQEFYWGYKGLEPPESKKIADEFARVSGYKSVRMIDSYAGYKDWFIQVWRRPGFTIELGTGVNPLPLQQFDEIYKDTLGILAASLYM